MYFKEKQSVKIKLFLILNIILMLFSFCVVRNLDKRTDPIYPLCQRLCCNVVKINALENGFGIITGEDQEGRLLIATCNHLVRSDEQEFDEEIYVSFYGVNTWETAQLKEYFLDLPGDLAVIEVSKPKNFSWKKDCVSLEYDQLGNIEVKSIGRQGDWMIPRSNIIINSDKPDEYSLITLESCFFMPGSSGAPVITKDGMLGIIVSDTTSCIAKALSINKIEEAFKKWNYSWKLELYKGHFPELEFFVWEADNRIYIFLNGEKICDSDKDRNRWIKIPKQLFRSQHNHLKIDVFNDSRFKEEEGVSIRKGWYYKVDFRSGYQTWPYEDGSHGEPPLSQWGQTFTSKEIIATLNHRDNTIQLK